MKLPLFFYCKETDHNVLTTQCPKCNWRMYIKCKDSIPKIYDQTTVMLRHYCMQEHESHRATLVYMGESKGVSLET